MLSYVKNALMPEIKALIDCLIEYKRAQGRIIQVKANQTNNNDNFNLCLFNIFL